MKDFEGWAVAAWGILVSHCPSARGWLLYLSLVLVILQIAIKARALCRKKKR
jgi:hypothetical protein